MITNSDLKKILDAIAKYGKKDSQLQKGRTPLTGKEYISIIQDGINKIVTLGDMYESLDFPFGFEIVEDHTAIENPDPKKVYREQGENQYIDYMYQDDTWEKLAEFNFPGIDSEPIEGSKNFVESDGIFRFKNSILEENRQMVNSIMENYKPVEVYGNVNNASDEEDLTSVNIQGTDVLKLKDKIYNSLVFSGLGKTYLRKNIQEVIDGSETVTRNILTQEMISESNTIYIIQYDYTLNEDITVPENCILEFDGGSLSGSYQLNLNNCQIKAPNICIFKGVNLTGTNNDIFNLCWLIENDDITAVINNLPNTIKKIVFNSDKNYYLNDTATFTSISYLDWNARVYYNGNKTDISVLRVVSCSGARVNINGLLSGENASVIDQVNDNTNVIGLEIVNCQNSTFYVAGIGYFNENLRISGLGMGCCNNKFFCGSSICANRHLRVYQNNVDGSIGWTNENYFYGGHFQNYSEWKSQNKKSTAIHIEGGDDDTYNKVNALTFINFNIENYQNMNGYTIYAKNIMNCSFLRIRNENGDYFMKVVGNCTDTNIDCSFGSSAIDTSECLQNNPLSIRSAAITKSVTVNLDKEIKKTSRNNYITSDILTDSKGNHVWYNSGTDFSGLAFNYNDVVGHVLYITQTKGIAYVSFVKDGQVVAPLSEGLNPFYTFITGKGYRTASNHYVDAIRIPARLDVDKVCVGFLGLTGTLTVSSNANLFYDIRITPTIGAYADVPTVANDIPLGHEYYCTDLGKKILWNGTAWVNLDGSVLS